MSQNYQKVSFGKGENEYYLAVNPASDEIKGALILLPGFGQAAETIFPESKIHNTAYANGILTIGLGIGPKLYTDESVIDRINKAIEHVKEKYQLQADQFVIGGFSAGGTISLAYTEHCFKNPSQSPIQPKGVFSVDSPVDLFHIWDYFERELERNFSEAGISEAKYVMNLMQEEIGNPVDQKSTYKALTPFHMDDLAIGNEQYLQKPAVRVYHELDIRWLIQNRRRSLIDTNALAASELINRLVQQGNEQAEFMLSKEAGHRSNGVRHPHSWSIVNELELIQWVKGIL